MNNLMIRNSVQLSLWVFAFALLFAVDPAWGGEESVVESDRKISAMEAKQYVLLEAHEPNRLGWTKDSDDHVCGREFHHHQQRSGGQVRHACALNLTWMGFANLW